jgi:hypothetical protein
MAAQIGRYATEPSRTDSNIYDEISSLTITTPAKYTSETYGRGLY